MSAAYLSLLLCGMDWDMQSLSKQDLQVGVFC